MLRQPAEPLETPGREGSPLLTHTFRCFETHATRNLAFPGGRLPLTPGEGVLGPAGWDRPPPIRPATPPRLSARRRCPFRSTLRRRLRRRVPAQEAASQPHYLHPAAGRSATPYPPQPRFPRFCAESPPPRRAGYPLASSAALDTSALLPSTSSKHWKRFLLKPTTPMCSLGKNWR